MNDPWLPLIAALSGQRTKTPSTWPVRRVHRLEGYVPELEAQKRRLAVAQRRAALPGAR